MVVVVVVVVEEEEVEEKEDVEKKETEKEKEKEECTPVILRTPSMVPCPWQAQHPRRVQFFQMARR